MLAEQDETLANLINATAQDLWDIGVTIVATGQAGPDDWELARIVASRMLAMLERPAETKNNTRRTR